MSSSAALATVTATLQNLLTSVVGGAMVTTQPPSIARATGGNGPQINLFLYGTHINEVLRNSPLPSSSSSGASGVPPLALVLKYLITAYGADNDDISAQQLLGQAMLLFHDHPLLSRTDIEGIAPDSGLQEQIERVRITPDPFNLDNMSKLWSSFQTAEYRLSATYEVSAVLIDSQRDSKAPLPVLRRGEQDRGPEVVATPAAVLQGLRFPQQKPGVELGDRLVLLGENLTVEHTEVFLQHPLLPTAIPLPPDPDGSTNELPVTLPALADNPNLSSQWPAGFYRIALHHQPPGRPAWSSNALAMPLSPQIISRTPASSAAGSLVLTLECIPQILPDQRVHLLFGERSLAADSITTPADPAAATTLVFTVTDAAARLEPYVLRLRVDGVDSIPVDFTGPVPVFADNQKVSVT